MLRTEGGCNGSVSRFKQEIVAYIMTDEAVDIDEAMKVFYDSVVCEKLADTETGLYLEGSAYVYELLKDELANGKIRL